MGVLRCIYGLVYIFPLLTEQVCDTATSPEQLETGLLQAQTMQVCLGQQTATGCKVMVVTVPAWPVQKLWLLLELLLLRKGAGSFPGSCHRPQCMRTGSQHIRAPFSSVFLPSFCCDTCLPSTSSNGNFACAAHLICKGRWGYC